jgi:hypothetical protein
MDEAKSRLQKENDSRGNMAGCEDEFDEEERMAKLIFLRFDDLSQECASILVRIPPFFSLCPASLYPVVFVHSCRFVHRG